MSRLINFYTDETGSESIEKITIIGGVLVLALAAVGFYTYQVNRGASKGADKTLEALEDAINS